MPEDSKTTHFGFRNVNPNEKAQLVGQVFASVANKYDLMNDLMSIGMHRIWKKIAIQSADLRPGQKILDLASGTGDLAREALAKIGKNGMMVMTDINEKMLNVGREKFVNKNILHPVHYALADAEKLPFQSDDFDRVMIGFGLRNVTNKMQALSEIYRVLKPGGKVMILEFSKPVSQVMQKLYDFYSFKVIPEIGAKVANDRESYEYLVESIRMHPGQETLKKLMMDAGFDEVHYTNLQNGIVAIHEGMKY